MLVYRGASRLHSRFEDLGLLSVDFKGGALVGVVSAGERATHHLTQLLLFLLDTRGTAFRGRYLRRCLD